MPDSKNSRRASRIFFALVVLIFGYSSRKFGAFLPPFLAEYAPDALWALMAFFLIAAAKPQWTLKRIGIAALLFAYTIEISQIYQAPWINAVRDTKIGALVLGHGFLWSDLICYAVGIGCGVILESLDSGEQKTV